MIIAFANVRNLFFVLKNRRDANVKFAFGWASIAQMFGEKED
jgi:hypothetical protein